PFAHEDGAVTGGAEAARPGGHVWGELVHAGAKDAAASEQLEAAHVADGIGGGGAGEDGGFPDEAIAVGRLGVWIGEGRGGDGAVGRGALVVANDEEDVWALGGAGERREEGEGEREEMREGTHDGDFALEWEEWHALYSLFRNCPLPSRTEKLKQASSL